MRERLSGESGNQEKHNYRRRTNLEDGEMGGKEEEGKRGRKGIRWMCRRGGWHGG